ncbi:MAG TPA: trigger factor [Candidatus Microsaccharimonas sp.]|nr:trigger factor [Candidatus Microsaccharimonas sp.]
MQITKDQLSPTNVKLTINADAADMAEVKDTVLQQLARTVKVPGFRAGKAPLHVVEKNVSPEALQTEFLDTIVNKLYVDAITQQSLRPVNRPDVSITKFVPFTTLEVVAEVEVIGAIKLPDYKKIKLAKPEVKVTAEDVNEILDNLTARAAEKKDVDRAAKNGDETTIDFTGVDAKTKEAIAGADGKDYPLVLGSNSFIPGFEDEVVGLKAGDEKTFDIVFPKDYGTPALQSKKVTFTIKVNKVQELAKPKLDDAFAATVGPFKTLAELKADIKKQVTAEREQQAQRDYESELLGQISEKTKAEIPPVLIEEEIDRAEADERQNLVYRGQTWEEHLKEEGVNEQEHRDKQRPAAEARVTAGLVLGEVAELEKISVSKEEVNIRMTLLKGQYNDPAMQAEFDKPEARRDITSRMLTEKTIAKLAEYASKK